MSLDGYRLRGAKQDDLDEVIDVMRADQVSFAGEADVTRSDLVGEWSRPSFDLAVHARVVEEDGSGAVVGYAEQIGGRAWAHVHPDHHGRGIGGSLLAWTIDLARDEGHPQVGQTIHDDNAAAQALATSHGMHVRWETWLLAIDLAGAIGAPEVPDDVVVRPLQKAADAADVHRVIEAAFATWPDRDEPMNFADWRAAFYDRPDVTSQTSVVALDTRSGELIGACVGLSEEGSGVIEQLGVHPDHMGRGIGEALLRSAFLSYRSAGLDDVWLSTESRTGARDFYERAGMTVRRSFKRWSLTLG